jgi:hypothetical protein
MKMLLAVLMSMTIVSSVLAADPVEVGEAPVSGKCTQEGFHLTVDNLKCVKTVAKASEGPSVCPGVVDKKGQPATGVGADGKPAVINGSETR